MFTTTATATSEAGRREPRGLASSALKTAGLIDRDASMRDVSVEKGRRSIPRKVGHRQRAIDSYKDGGVGPSRTSMLATRVGAKSDPLAIRGAASRPTAVGRLRRTAAGIPQLVTTKGSTSKTTSNVIEVWRDFVKRRYNADAKFLNLERMIEDDALKKAGILPPGLPGTSSREMAVVFKLASQLKPPVETISLANNSLVYGTYLTTLSHYLPRLSNLSLQGNSFKTWKDLDSISMKNNRLENLRELILLGNPIRELEVKNGREEAYRTEITRRFPSLEVLDQTAVAKISFNVPLPSSSSKDPHACFASSFPLPMASSFITGVEGSVIGDFLTRFFNLFDEQRAGLVDVYAPEATFSYSVNTTIPPRARAQRLHVTLPNQTKLQWEPWLENSTGGSRNLTRIGTTNRGLDKVVGSLHTGPEAIVKAMSGLPQTKHDVAGAAEKFCFDAWPVGQGDAMLLFLSVHGEFAEAPSQGIRSFDRSFILAPAASGSRANLAGWAVSILSDQLIVRAYSSCEAWAPGPLKVQGAESNTAAAAPSTSAAVTADVQALINAGVASIPEPQRSMVVTICQRTGLNVKFAIDCLESNSWDTDKAVANFEQVKASLSREAFL